MWLWSYSTSRFLSVQSSKQSSVLLHEPFLCVLFGGLECVGHSFDVVHSWFFRDVWIRTLRAWCDKQLRYQLSDLSLSTQTIKWKVQRRPVLYSSLVIFVTTQYVYIKSTTVYVPSSEYWLSQPLSRQRVCPSPQNRGGGDAHSPAGEGLGESQFWRLEKKLCTLPTLCLWLYLICQCTYENYLYSDDDKNLHSSSCFLLFFSSITRCCSICHAC